MKKNLTLKMLQNPRIIHKSLTKSAYALIVVMFLLIQEAPLCHHHHYQEHCCYPRRIVITSCIKAYRKLELSHHAVNASGVYSYTHRNPAKYGNYC